MDTWARYQVVYGYEDEAISRSAQIWTRKMPRLFMSVMAGFCFYPVWKAS